MHAHISPVFLFVFVSGMEMSIMSGEETKITKIKALLLILSIVRKCDIG